MEGYEYTCNGVAALLRVEDEDIEGVVDLIIAIEQMPEPTRTFLVYVHQGYSILDAMEKAGVHGNSTRVWHAALEQLTQLMNGERHAEEGRNNK